MKCYLEGYNKCYILVSNMHKCDRCKRIFSAKHHLTNHLNRKKVCDSVEEFVPQSFVCEHCDKGFTRKTSLQRHYAICKKNAQAEVSTTDQRIANIENLMLTLAARLEEKGPREIDPRQKKTPIDTKIHNTVDGDSNFNANGTNSGNNNNNTTIASTVNIQNYYPWDGNQRMLITAADLNAAVKENPIIREYSRMGTEDKTDAKKAQSYVTEIFTDLTRRSHSKAESQNIHLSKNQSNQVIVHMRSGEWEIMPLDAATRLMFEGIVVHIYNMSADTKNLKTMPDVLDTMNCASLVFKGDPDGYARIAKVGMISHLTNLRNQRDKRESSSVEYKATPDDPSIPLADAPRTYTMPLKSDKPLETQVKSSICKRWTVLDVADQITKTKWLPGEALPEYIARLVLESGVEKSIWANKLWEAIDDKIIPEAHIADAQDMLQCAESG